MIIKQGVWHSVTEGLISQALASASLADIKAQVEAGAQLFEAVHDGQTVAAFVLRIDRMAEKNEGVIVAAAGQLNGVDLTKTLVPVIEKMFVGCQSVRIHTGRVGVAKKMEMQGYAVTEMVLTKGLP